MDAQPDADITPSDESTAALRIRERTLRAFDQGTTANISEAAKNTIRDRHHQQIRISEKSEDMVRQVVQLEPEKRAAWLAEQITEEVRVSLSLKLSETAYARRFASAREVRELGRLAQTVISASSEWLQSHHDAMARAILNEANGLRIGALARQAILKIDKARSHIEAGTGDPNLRLFDAEIQGSVSLSEEPGDFSRSIGASVGLAYLLGDRVRIALIQCDSLTAEVNATPARNDLRPGLFQGYADVLSELQDDSLRQAAAHLNIATLILDQDPLRSTILEEHLASVSLKAETNPALQAYILVRQATAADLLGNQELANALRVRALESFAVTGHMYSFIRTLLELAEQQIKCGDNSFARNIALRALQLSSGLETERSVRESLEVWLTASLHQRLDEALVGKLRTTLDLN